ncbi:ribosome-inactivating family protein [Paenibacillus humicola]|uniref:ribosome-inactivating family protein n=1 Tax=Paenibacillus humicola TaxID=3110540 RepID=UPI00237B55E0|nr:ribosome-inactivating family protein [Paenibacillus humicola]
MRTMYRKFQRKIRTAAFAFMAIVMAVTGTFFAKGGVAHADVPEGQINHVYINLNSPSFTAQGQYSSFISSLRQAAGHYYRSSDNITQYIPRASDGVSPYIYGTGLVMVTLTAGSNTLTLWITPGDMYLRGFTNVYGQTFSFNDSDYSLRYHLALVGRDQPVTLLGFGSNYNSIRQAASQGRESMQISWNDLWNSMFNLMYTTNPFGNNQQAVARSLQFMIQYTSEAARFNDVYGVMSDIMHSYSAYYNGLPLTQQYLENAWQDISTFGTNITNNPSTSPQYINGVGTLYSWSDVARYLALLLNTANRKQDTTGNWDHTEL